MDVAIVGIGIHPFGRFDGISGLAMGEVAARRALADAGVEWREVQVAFGGSAEAGYPDTLVSRLGLSGVPFFNVSNGCTTGGAALALAVERIRSGDADIGLAVGFDKHSRGAFAPDPADLGLPEWYAASGLMLTTQFFAMKLCRYMHDFGVTAPTLAKVAAKAFRNGALNPNAWRQKPMAENEIAGSRMLNYPLTQYMFCSPNEGAAAVVLCRGDRASAYTDQPVFVRSVALHTRRFGSFEVMAPCLPLEQAASPTVQAAADCYEAAGIGPDEVGVAQLQDSEVGAEVMHMSETGLCRDGEQEAMVQAGDTEITGCLPVNTDGGLIANGEPIGASALRQIHELVLQLRGNAGERQMPKQPMVGFAQVYGAPGVGCCTLLSR